MCFECLLGAAVYQRAVAHATASNTTRHARRHQHGARRGSRRCCMVAPTRRALVLDADAALATWPPAAHTTTHTAAAAAAFRTRTPTHTTPQQTRARSPTRVNFNNSFCNVHVEMYKGSCSIYSFERGGIVCSFERGSATQGGAFFGGEDRGCLVYKKKVLRKRSVSGVAAA